MTALNSIRKQAITRTFTIDPKNNVKVHDSKKLGSSAASLVKFESEEDLAALAANWPGRRLVEIWNKLPGTRGVRSFTDRATAVHRIWRAVEGPGPRGGRHEATRRATAPRRGKGAARAKAAGKNDTKTQQILSLLERVKGATLEEIMALTGWQRHSVRGFISGHSKKIGIHIKSFKRNGERVYRIQT